MFEDQFFLHKKMNAAKLLEYGFVKTEAGYQHSCYVMDGQMQLLVYIGKDNIVTTRMIDISTDEEYLLYKVPSSVGAFVGEARTACENVLIDIAKQCFEPDVFHGEQTLAVIQYVREHYGDELEFLWEKFSNNAVWRRKDNQKWYGLVIAISKRKLGIDADEIVEAMDLRLPPEQMAETIDHEHYFPGWHMNKKSWYTVLLNGSVPTEEIYQRIEESYRLAVK